MTDTIDKTINVAHPDRFYIGGEWAEPSSGNHLDLISPVTEHVFMSVAAAANDDLERAVEAARDAFDDGPWPRMSPQERIGYIRKLAEALRRRTHDLALVQTLTSGSLFQQNMEYTGHTIGFLDMYAGIGEKFDWERDEQPAIPGTHAKLVAEPVGVVTCIAPWNGPLFLIMPKVAPALMAGCTVIMKPAPSTPLEALIVAECAEEIGFPAGVINLLTADNDVSNYLVLNPGIDKVASPAARPRGRRSRRRLARGSVATRSNSAASRLRSCSTILTSRRRAQTSA